MCQKIIAPPDKGFHKKILDRITSEKITVIWGAPGIGKSTYISYLFDCLKKQESIVIRHHFFLSVSDNVSDRIRYYTVVASLRGQLEKQFKNISKDDKNLREILTKTAEEIRNTNSTNKNLYIIIDGLDHVWRERGEIGQLNQLFNDLVPSPADNIRLIIGTQKVPTKELPNVFASHVLDSDWLQLPNMSQHNVADYVKPFFTDGFIMPLSENAAWQTREIAELSELLYTKTNGHPLHLHYTIQHIQNNGEGFSRDTITATPDCPDGDINLYYQRLWQSLTTESEELLHLIASSLFHWVDENSFYDCLGNDTIHRDAYKSIQHMIIKQKSGIHVFHESILVFIRKQPSHVQAAQRLLPKTKEWLETKAPDYWNWAYLWLIQAQLGAPDNLINLPDREWIIAALAKAYPYKSIDNILAKAEEEALKAENLSQLIKLRHLRGRLINLDEFSYYDEAEFLNLVLSSNADSYIFDWMADNLNLVDTNKLPVIANHLGDDHPHNEKECFDEVYNRLKFHYNFSSESESDNIKSELFALIKIAANSKSISIAEHFSFIRGWSNAEELFQKFLDSALLGNRGEEILRLWEHDNLNNDFKIILSEFTARYFLKHNINIQYRPEAQNLKFCYLGQCLLLYHKIDFKEYPLPSINLKQFQDGIGTLNWKNFWEEFFYEALAIALKAKGEFSYLYPSLPERYKEQDTFKDICYLLQKLAYYIANILYNSPERLHDITFLYDFLASFSRPSNNVDNYQILNGINSSLLHITLNCVQFIAYQNHPSPISCNEYKKLLKNHWFNEWEFIEFITKHQIKLLADDTAEYVVKKEHDNLMIIIEEQGELSKLNLQTAQLAFLYDLKDYTTTHIQQTCKVALGYRWHKDMTVFHVMEAISYYEKHTNLPIEPWLKRLEPIINNIREYTDGDETSHAPHDFIELLAKKSPQNLVPQFQYYQLKEKWHFQEDICSKIIEISNLSQPDVQAFIKTMMMAKPLETLKKKADEDDKIASKLLEEQLVFLGGYPDEEKEHGNSDLNDYKSKKITVDFKKYPAEKLEDLISFLKQNEIIWRKDYIEDWFAYWVKQGEAIAIINAIEAQFQKNKLPHEIEDILWKVFELSIEAQGKAEAFKWAVRVSGYQRIWSRYYYHGSNEKLDKIACDYQRKWLKFIKESAKISDRFSRKNWLNVGEEMLVYFLLKVKQKKLAYHVIEALLSSLEDDVSHMPLPKTRWIDNKNNESIAFQALMLMLNYPILPIKIRAAQQIAKLLQEPYLKTYKILFLTYLSEQTLEADICACLVPLGLSGNPPLISLQEAQSNISAPSILSDNMLENIYDKPNTISCLGK